MTTVVADRSVAPAWRQAWSDALAELELSVDQAEAMLTAGRAPAPAGAWSPPTGLGMLPAALEERARALLGRQARVAQQLAEAATHSRRRLRVVDGLRADGEAVPVYLDTAG